MKITLAILSILLVCSLLACLYYRGQYVTQTAKNQELEEVIGALEQTTEALQRDDIQRLIEHVRRVMAAEILIEDMDNPLWSYSYSESTYPAMDRVEVYLNIREIILDEDSGEMKADYVKLYYDSSERVIRGSSAGSIRPAKWTLSRQGNDWIITEIDEHP